jgi:PKD repeat protein
MNTPTGKIQKKSALLHWLITCYILISSLFLIPVPSQAKDYSFTWAANPEPVEGYKLYFKEGGNAGPPFDGTGALQGASPISVGKQTTFTILGLKDNTTYHFALTAYNGNDESAFSTIISAPEPEIPLTAIISTTPQEGAAPFSVTFDATDSTGPVSSYSWSFGDGETASGSTAEHTYQFSGTYTATLSIEDDNGSSSTTDIVISVTEPTQPPPGPTTPPDAVISSSTTVGNAPLTMQFDGSNSTTSEPPMVLYSWDFGDGGVAEGSLVSHTYNDPGNYYASLTVTDNIGQTDTTSISVTISDTQPENQAPISSFTASSASGTSPLNVLFDGSGSNDPDGTIQEYQWDFGDGSSASGISPEHTFTGIAGYTVKLSVTDNLGGTAVSTKTISVHDATVEENNDKAKFIIPIINLLLLE